MSVRVLPAVVATLCTLVLAVVLFVPFVAREFRRRGEFRAGTVALRFAALLYGFALVAYVLIPLPPVAPGFCAAFAHLHPQWHPFASLHGLDRPGSWTGLSRLLSDSSVHQFGFNVLLFVPLGMLLRHLLRRGPVSTVLSGFAVSLGVELTQLTGIWFLYPCPYRLFDVDDLIANTAGALIGAALAPALRLVPAQYSGVHATRPRPVTTYRRLLGMGCDGLLLWWLGSIAIRAVDLGVRLSGAHPAHRSFWEAVALWFGPAAVLLLTALIGRGNTLGQYAVMLRTTTRSGGRPPAHATLRRWLCGLGGLAVLLGVAHVAWPGAGFPLMVVWCTAHALGAGRTGNHRGITGRFSGLHVVDARAQRTAVMAVG